MFEGTRNGSENWGLGLKSMCLHHYSEFFQSAMHVSMASRAAKGGQQGTCAAGCKVRVNSTG